MRKKYFKGITGLTIATLLMSSISTATPLIASAENQNSVSLEDFSSFVEIPNYLLDPNFYLKDEIIYIPEEYFNPYHPDAIGVTYITDNDGQVKTRAIAAAAGTYLIPGIGQVALTITGAVVIGGVTIAAGSWLYNQVATYFAKKTAEKAADEIPNSLKSGDMQVDLGKFKNKYGKTAKETTSNGPFTNGNWHLEKDTAGHLGYNGEKKAWKVWKKGASERTASLDKNGNVIDK